jgi:hypothetical protein
MKERAAVASREPIASDTVVVQSRQMAWDPHDVWLTRVKQPRELAARQQRAARRGDVAPEYEIPPLS